MPRISQFLSASILSIGLSTGLATPGHAGSTPYIGEIMMVGYPFCPRGWVEASGQLLEIVRNEALFALYGTTFGGDGRVSFGLPDLRGRVPMHTGRGPGLTQRPMGQRAGAEQHTLSVGQMPPHSHALNASSATANAASPSGNVLADTNRASTYVASTPNQQMSSSSISSSGQGQPVSNMQPYEVLRFCLATVGQFPSRD
ncbi:phage tail protein [Poseidonocella sedimentorum]|nr:tail fiber protein [Poseidonocella sedimentorum]